MSMLEGREFRFENYRLLPDERLLVYGDKPVALPPKAFDALLLLVKNSGHLLEKDDFFEEVWPDTIVEEATLAKTISMLRKALNEDEEHKFIETVPKSGYRFVAEVTVEESGKGETGETGVGAADIRRRSSGKRFVRPLGRPVLLLTLILFAAGGVALVSSWNWQPEETGTVKSIAVLPFRQIGSGERDEMLEFGMTDTLITRLSNLKEIAVRPTTAIAKYNGSEAEPQEIGSELKVDAVLTGSIQRHGERLRVNVQLVSTATGSALWAGNFDTEFSNIFKIQDSIARQTVTALVPRLDATLADNDGSARPWNTDAYERYVTGRFHWNRRTPDSLRKAIGNFEQALAIDPDYGLAYSGLADCYQLLAEYQVLTPDEAFPKAREAAQKALAIDEELAEAHTSLAYTLAFYDREFDEADRQFRRAIELDPNYPTAHQWYGEFLAAVGRFPEARREFEIAQSLDPTSLIVRSDLAGHFYFTRQYDLAIRESEKIISLDPSFPYGYVFKWLALTQKREETAAARAYVRATELFGETVAASELERLLDEKGPQAMWLKRLEQVNDPARRSTFPEVQRGMIYLRVGDRERALKSFEASLERRERWAVNLKFSPEVDPLRSDPKFEALLRKLGIGTSVTNR
ncbi:MAG: winged helix-turn-helix domain-containing protein [Aridibacter famidurans]|nr:winged helix-turn-helix domain-containing protein [Aridibacter famidurans]